MKHQIDITCTAEYDLNDAVTYIDLILKNKAAADKFLDDFESAMDRLASFPASNPIVDDTVLAMWGIRFVKVDNYLVFYFIQGDSVQVVRIIHEKREWITILKDEYL